MAQDDTQDTGAAEAAADEGAQLESFLSDRGIEVDEAGIVAGEEDDGGSVRDPDDPDDDGSEAAEPDPEPEPRGLAFKLREQQRQLEAAAQEIRSRDNYLNALLRGIQMGGGLAQQQAQGQQQAPIQEPPDLFTDPDRYVDYRLQQAMGPMLQELQHLRQQSAALVGERQQERQQQEVGRYVQSVRSLAEQYDSENPGYFDRVTAMGEEYQRGLVEHGWAPEEAQQAWGNELGAMANAAMQRGTNPAAFVDYHARRYLGGSQAAAPPPPQQRVNGQIAAAQRAQQAGATRRGGAPGGELTIDAVRRAGVSPEKVEEAFAHGGRGAFLRMMKEAGG